MNIKENLIKLINEKKAKVGIIGLGYVGLPLSLRFSEGGFFVCGFDIDKKKVEKINKGETYISQFSSERITNVVNKNLLKATYDFSLIKEMDAIIICVPTPLGKHNDPDISFIVNTMESILPYIREGQIISLESTTYPGTTEEEIVARVEKKGFKVGENYFVVFSPEREDPGNKKFHTQIIPKVLGGYTSSCREIGTKLYGSVIDKIVEVSSTKAAEMTKLLENIFRSVNIGLVNELKIVCDKMGIDIWEVIDAASTKPFGYMPFYPGPGLGGHCIPIDPFYLTWKAHEYKMHTRFIELAGEINTSMPEWVVTKTIDGLNRFKKAINGANILVLGLAYKKNVSDTRESPSVEVMELLLQKGAIVDYSDPYVLEFPEMRKHKLDLKSVALTENNLKKYDAIIIATDHDDFDYDFILKNSALIIDTRGRYRKNYPNVIKA